MGTWLVTVEFESNGKVDHKRYQVYGNDIYSAITEVTYYLDEGVFSCPFDAEDGYSRAIVAIELLD